MFFLVIFIYHLIAAFGLSQIFPKAGETGWKAYVPVLNLLTAFKIVGRPSWHLVWFFLPIINIFYWCYLLIELANSVGRFAFLEHLYACIAPFAAFFQWGKDEESRYMGPDYTKWTAYNDGMKAALNNNDKAAENRLKREYPQYQKDTVRDWAETAIFAVFAAAFIRMFLFEAYVIPSESMEGSLLVGDYMVVSKTSFGMRMPNTILQLPLVHNTIPFLGSESYNSLVEMDYRRFNIPFLSGGVERYDPFVFNYPEGDTVAFAQPTPAILQSDMAGNFLSDMPYSHYYGIERKFNSVQGGGHKFVVDNFKIVTRPVDKRDNFIKRCVGLPGDKIEIKNRILFVNGVEAPKPPKMQFNAFVFAKEALNSVDMEQMHVNLGLLQGTTTQQAIYRGALNAEQITQLKTLAQIDSVVIENRPMGVADINTFPHDTANYKFNIDNFGPITIPKKGVTIQLTPQNVSLYHRLITTYEHHSLSLANGKITIDGKEVTSYTPAMDYYWAMGDNRHNSEDSRIWGYVPEDHIVGKPLFIWFSKGTDGIRWNRFFTGTKRLQ